MTFAFEIELHSVAGSGRSGENKRIGECFKDIAAGGDGARIPAAKYTAAPFADLLPPITDRSIDVGDTAGSQLLRRDLGFFRCAIAGIDQDRRGAENGKETQNNLVCRQADQDAAAAQSQFERTRGIGSCRGEPSNAIRVRVAANDVKTAADQTLDERRAKPSHADDADSTHNFWISRFGRAAMEDSYFLVVGV